MPYSAKDSAIFRTILKKLYGPHLEYYCFRFNVELDSIDTWSNAGIVWKWCEDIGEKRLVYLFLSDPFKQEDIYYGHIPTEIWDFDSLRTIAVGGINFVDDFPSRNGKGEAVEYVHILGTSISRLHSDLFDLPRLKTLQIQNNYKLERLPWDLESIQWESKTTRTFYDLRWNNLSGEIPIIYNQPINVGHNNYSSINWGRWKSIDFENEIRNYTDAKMCGPFVDFNRLSGEVPDYILSDTFALFHTYYVTRLQQNGYGLKGFPPIDTIKKMRDEVLERHPELKENLKFLIPYDL